MIYFLELTHGGHASCWTSDSERDAIETINKLSNESGPFSAFQDAVDYLGHDLHSLRVFDGTQTAWLAANLIKSELNFRQSEALKKCIFCGDLSKAAMYMHPASGDVQSGADWYFDSYSWDEGEDIHAALSSLIEVERENGEWAEI